MHANNTENVLAGKDADSTTDVDASLNPVTEPDENEPWVRYSIEWRDQEDHFKGRDEVTEQGANIYTLNVQRDKKTPIFERLSVFRTKSIARLDEEKKSEESEVPTLLPGSTPIHYLRIFSAAIIHAIRSVVQYYPDQDLSGDIVEIKWPYPILVHHYDELVQLREECLKKDPGKRCVREKDVDKHVKMLLSFLDKEVMGMVNAEKERNKRGSYTFDYMWVAMKPGTSLLSKIRERKEEDEREPRVIYSLSGGFYESPRQNWNVKSWAMEYDGTYLGRKLWETTFLKFDGERRYITGGMLLGGPEDIASAQNHEIVRQAIDQGKAFWDLMDTKYMYYKGLTMGIPRNEIRGMVMIDLDSYYSGSRRRHSRDYYSPVNDNMKPLMDQTDHRDFITDCSCRICSNDKSTKSKKSAIFEHYDLITRRSQKELSDHQYFLCPKMVYAFVFKTRTWEKILVRNLSPPKFQRQMIETLVMDEGRLKTLKSLTESFARLDSHGRKLAPDFWTADYVQGKGNGLIFLLHGGPGVGKTFTAECIANFLERPLMVLTTSDIGTKSEDVEENLMRNFKMAKSWNAVLLIDEADVFVANRTIQDLHRSSLVASFLRALEFYDGILFLTTNRVGAFDDAILSRVHIQLFYPDLTADQRQTMWKTFINKLEAEKPSIRVKYAVKEYLRSNEMRNFEMNGREIRNAFQTAVALAEHRAEQDEEGKTLLTEDHLREVIELSRSFKTYFSELHGSEGKRANQRGERLESFIKAIEEKMQL